MYWRDFQTPNQKNYLFLGRSRILIRPRSRLHKHLQSLSNEKRFATISYVINLLAEDAAGHRPPTLADLL